MDGGQPVFLLIRDSYGHWGFPKGHLERGEDANVAAMREVTEETGVRALTLVGSVETIEWFFRFRGRLIHKRCEFFLMTTDRPATTPQEAEGITDCRWVNAEEAEELIEYENARTVLRLAKSMVAGRLAESPRA